MTTDTLPLCPVAASRGWARVFATMYDPFLWLGERAGMRRHRRALLAQARGQTLEIGSGTGLNLVHYPDNLDGLVLAEPDPSMRQRLQTAMRRSGRNAQVIDARAEQLPFADASVDTVISTFLLCTVDAPETALREIGRVLRPDGQLLFVEHVRSASPLLARWQDRLARPWQRFAVGCRCNRAIVELIDACGFRVDARPAAWRAMPPIIRPLAIGRATIGHMISQPDPICQYLPDSLGHGGGRSRPGGKMVAVERRFHGPVGSGHGGYTRGPLARAVPGRRRMSLRVPPLFEESCQRNRNPVR